MLLGQGLQRLVSWLATRLAAEMAAFELALVVPIFLGLGVIAYFAAPEEPDLIFPAFLTVGRPALPMACGGVGGCMSAWSA